MATDVHHGAGPAAAHVAAGRPGSRSALVMGIAALTKVSGFVWGAGLATGLALSPARRHLRSPWPWAAVAIAVVLFLPHVWWQAAHGWPTAEFVRNAQANKIVPLAPAAFLREQIMLLGPVGAIVAVVGLIALAWGRLSVGRTWAVAVVFTLTVFLLQRSKAYYVMPAYPVLLVAGAVTSRTMLAPRTMARRLAIAGMLALGLPLVPLTLPVLPPATLQAYMARLGLGVSSAERHEVGAGSAAAFRRHVRLGGVGRRRGARRAHAAGRGTRDGADLRPELRGGRRARVLRPVTCGCRR